MAESPDTTATRDFAFESFGVRIGISIDRDEVHERVMPLLPPSRQPCSTSLADLWFGVITDPNGDYQFTRDGSPVTKNAELELALMLLENQIRIQIGLRAPDRIFIHAGVVGHEGRAIVMPGLSFAGKTTLVAALVRKGALYYSDEFAVLDPQGVVHPYPKALAIRDADEVQVDHELDSLGGVEGVEPIPVGAVVVTRHVPGAVWDPKPASLGRGALAMMSNALAAIQRTEETMAAITRAVQGAVVVEGERGEADAIVGDLLQLVAKQP